MMLTKKLDNMESATVDIEMNVTLFKIWGHRFPHTNLWVHTFHLTPGCISDSTAMDMGRYEQKFQLSTECIFIDANHYATYDLTIFGNAVSLSIWGINSLFNGVTGDDLAILFKVVITQSELFCGSIFKSLLIVEDKLVAV